MVFRYKGTLFFSFHQIIGRFFEVAIGVILSLVSRNSFVHERKREPVPRSSLFFS